MNYRKKQIVDSLTSTSSSGSLISNGNGALSSPNREGKQQQKVLKKEEGILTCYSQHLEKSSGPEDLAQEGKSDRKSLRRKGHPSPRNRTFGGK